MIHINIMNHTNNERKQAPTETLTCKQITVNNYFSTFISPTRSG